MKYTTIIFLLLLFTETVQAEWNWVCWQRHTRINGQQEEVLSDWRAVALFADKSGCEDHVEAILYRLSERFKERKDGSEVLFLMITDIGKDFGKLAGVLNKKGNQSSRIESRCLQQKTATIRESGFTGNDYRQLTHIEKRKYVSGIVDGTLTAPVFGAPKENMEWIEKCITHISEEQFVAILEKFMADNPIRWSNSMQSLFLSAMASTCLHEKNKSE